MTPKRIKPGSNFPSSRAFTLIEVTLALGLASFCLLSVFALLPISLASDQSSIEQATAVDVSSSIVTDLRTTQRLGTKQSPSFGIFIPAAPATSTGGVVRTSGTTIFLSASGRPDVTNPSQVVLSGSNVSRYRATIGFYFPSNASAPAQNATMVRILITWPALADPTDSSHPTGWPLSATTPANVWPKNYTGSYEVETALDRN